MNNDELKKKILTIVRGAMLEADELPFVETTEYVADALIAAGIGDVKEVEKEYRNTMLLAVKSQTLASERSRYMELNKNIAEHRAEVAERALKNRAISHVSKCFPNEISGLENCVQEVYEAWIYQAEKELAELKGE